ncbi:MAG: hypothetical protein AB7G28_24760 [Pirellulales bacterium]
MNLASQRTYFQLVNCRHPRLRAPRHALRAIASPICMNPEKKLALGKLPRRPRNSSIAFSASAAIHAMAVAPAACTTHL